MKKTSEPSVRQQIIGLVTALVFLGAIVWLAIWAIGQLPSTLTTAVVTGGVALVGSTLAVVIGKSYERKREIEAAFRDKKIAVYDEFFEKLFALLHNTAETEDLVPYLRDHQRRLILWSGDKAVHEYAKMMRAFRGGAATAGGMLALEEYFLAVRSDLGHSNAGIKRGDLISFMLTNGDLLIKLHDQDPDTAMDKLIELEAEQKRSKS